MNITCSVSSCLCHGTCLPGSYCTRQSSTWSPQIAWRRTPSTNSHESRPFQVRKGREPVVSSLDTEEPLTAVRRDGRKREVIVVDHPLAFAARLLLRREGREHAIGCR